MRKPVLDARYITAVIDDELQNLSSTAVVPKNLVSVAIPLEVTSIPGEVENFLAGVLLRIFRSGCGVGM